MCSNSFDQAMLAIIVVVVAGMSYQETGCWLVTNNKADIRFQQKPLCTIGVLA